MTKQFTVTLRRTIVETAIVTVEARSKPEAIYRAGKDEPAWKQDVGEPEIASVEVVGSAKD